jgi:hypothetical protein
VNYDEKRRPVLAIHFTERPASMNAATRQLTGQKTASFTIVILSIAIFRQAAVSNKIMTSATSTVHFITIKFASNTF